MRGREGFETLRRIALLLLALAILADRATGRGHAVRSRVLFLLRPAETAARDLADDLAARFIPFTPCDERRRLPHRPPLVRRRRG